jgi:hypothetical protein
MEADAMFELAATARAVPKMKLTDEPWKEILETDAFAKSLEVWIESRRERL